MEKPKEKQIIQFRHNEYEIAWIEGWNAACEEWEEWEKERPARWIMCDGYEWEDIECSRCGHRQEVSRTSLGIMLPVICPGCKREMEW